MTLLIGLGVAAGALFFFARLASEMLEGDAKQFDDWARSGIHQFASPALTSTMRVVTIFALTSKRLLESVLSLAKLRLASETSLTSCVDRRLASANREGFFGPPVKIK